MPAFEITRWPDLPVVYLKTYAEFRWSEHFELMVEELRTYLDNSPAPLYVIDEVEDFAMKANDLFWAASYAAQSPDAILHHPNLIELVVVSTNSVIELAAKGMRTEVFGSAPVMVKPTLDEALSYIDSKL